MSVNGYMDKKTKKIIFLMALIYSPESPNISFTKTTHEDFNSWLKFLMNSFQFLLQIKLTQGLEQHKIWGLSKHNILLTEKEEGRWDRTSGPKDFGQNLGWNDTILHFF